MDQNMKALARFLNSAHSVYHATAALEAELRKAGYTRLQEDKAWELVPGRKYYLTRGGTEKVMRAYIRDAGLDDTEADAPEAGPAEAPEALSALELDKMLGTEAADEQH